MVQEETERYNEDELVAPEWMNKEYFQQLLRNTQNDDSIIVKNVVTKPGSKMNDHYASVMFRAIINYSTTKSKDLEKSLIVKTMPFVEGPKKEMLEGMNMFDVEIRMYNEVIPKFEKMLRDAGDSTQLGGKCLYAEKEPRDVLIFEDLTKENYTTVDNWGGSFEIAKKAVEKLAKWHAMSHKMVSDGDLSLQEFTKNAFTDGNMIETPVFKYGFKNFVDMLKTVPELNEYTKNFEAILSKDPLNKCLDVYRAFTKGDKANLFVLNHGDFHIKNLMFTKTDCGKIGDVLLVDYQVCIWAPAVVDLIYMLYMMLDDEDRITKREEITHHYFVVLTETLKKLKFTGPYPKLTDLYKDFITFRNFELMLLTNMLPFIMAIKEDPAMDIGAVLHGENAGRALYDGKAFQDYIKRVLPDFLHKGYLDW